MLEGAIPLWVWYLAKPGRRAHVGIGLESSARTLVSGRSLRAIWSEAVALRVGGASEGTNLVRAHAAG